MFPPLMAAFTGAGAWIMARRQHRWIARGAMIAQLRSLLASMAGRLIRGFFRRRSIPWRRQGGTGQEPRPFANPYVSGLGKVYVRRTAHAEKGRWFDEKAEISRDWRAAFKGTTVPPVLEIVIGTDVEDTKARLDARIERIRFAPC